MVSRLSADSALDGSTKVSQLIQHISSLQNPRIKSALRLHSSRVRKDQNRMIVFGRREFERALQANIEFAEIFIRQDADQDVLDLIPQSGSDGAHDTFAATVSSEVFSKLMFGDRPDAIVGVAARPSMSIEDVKFSSPGFVLVLQAIEKPGNLGAILRSADACNAAAVLLADSETDFYHPNSIRASTGSVFTLPLATGSSKEIQDWIEGNQLSVVTAIVEGATDIFDADLTGDIAIVLGNEARGLNEKWRSENFVPIRLPMQGIADSLNVSVTASVMMYETVRQQKKLK